MLMMRPHFCSFMYGIAARAQRSAPTYFTLKSWCRSSSTTDSMGPVAVAEPPGGEPLLTRMRSEERRVGKGVDLGGRDALHENTDRREQRTAGFNRRDIDCG